ncbi:ExeA family protein [Cellvibrio sp. PSBB023]|uniref:ExeA family protein n=1 Tax=Cellvibrio sp. PSBB023 TaxID=1945512 RepID=UPI00098ED81B|nr:AAA family ATPase [Cellvibrio sp. PSBB023]AQT58695.1 transposase [Cellvibrio sp. PSBB023]
MLALKKTLNELGLLQTALAIHCNVSDATIAQLLNHGLWPKTEAKAKTLREKILEFLAPYNSANDAVFDVVEAEPMKHLQAVPKPIVPKADNKSEEDDHMLLRRQSLKPEAKRHFGVMRDPFADLTCAEDMWVSPDIRYVRECMFTTAKHGGFLAVVGESGSGKSIIATDLEQRIHDENLPITLIKPYVLAAEETESRGTMLKSAHVAESILRTLAPNSPVRIGPEARFRQIHNALIESHKSGYSNCILIEEAHSMPITTLRHLKRILELRIGFTPLVSVILIGQPELKIKLSERNADVREVVQRCEMVTLNPMRPELVEEFLSHRFARVGVKLENIIDQTGITRIAQRLVSRAQESQLYPLAIGNFVLAAMNIAANIGVPVIDESIIDEVV